MSGFCVGERRFETAEALGKDNVEGELQHRRHLKELLGGKDWKI